MNGEISGASLKRELVSVLSQDDFGQALFRLPDYPVKKSINAMISFLCHRDDRIRWRSVSGLGFLVSRLFESQPEESRIIMRRFMWMLNEESGGIGWGVPETMGEIIALNDTLGREYNRIIVSYLDENGNFLDHAPLRTGVLWGIERISEIKPQLVKTCVDLVEPYLESDIPMDRGLACLICGHQCIREAVPQLNHLIMDKSEINLYKEEKFSRCTVSDLAGKALNRLS